MSNFLPENTSYKGQSGLPTGDIDFASLNKSVNAQYNQAKSNFNQQAQSGGIGATKKPLKMSTGLEPDVNAQFPGLANLKLNPHDPIAPPPTWEEMLISEYNTKNPERPLHFIAPSAGEPDLTDTPSAQAKIVTNPRDNGGGQYLIDPGSPGKFIKGVYDFDPNEKQLILGALPASSFQIDHIVPRWAGGADTLHNKEILSIKDHEKKTAIQAVPYTLYYYTKILNADPNKLFPDQKAMLAKLTPEQAEYLKSNPMTIDQARSMAMPWRSRSSTDIPTVRDQDIGLLPIDAAIRASREWALTPEEKKDLKSELKGVPKAIDELGGKLKNKITWGLNQVPVLGALGTGIIQGATNEMSLGYGKKLSPSFNSTSEQDFINAANDPLSMRWGALAADIAGESEKGIEYEQKLQHFNSMAAGVGQALGGIYGSLILYKGGASLLAKLPVVGKLFRSGQVLTEGASSIPGAGFLIKEGGQAAANLGTSAKIVGELSNAAKAIGPGSSAMVPTLNAIVGKSKIMVDGTKLGGALINDWVKKMAGNFGLVQIMSELHQQDDRSLEAMGKRAMSNLAYAGLEAKSGHDIGGYLKTAVGSMSISLIEGNDFQDSLMNAAIMTGMHGFDHKSGRQMELSRKNGMKPVEHYGSYAAEKHLSQLGLLPDPGTYSPTWKPSEKFLKLSGDEKINLRAKGIEKINDMANSQVTLGPDGKSYTAGWDEGDVRDEYLRLNTALRQLEKGGMTKEARTKADLADLRSTMDAIASKDKQRDIQAPNVIKTVLDTNNEYLFSRGKREADVDLAGDPTLPTGSTAVTGVAGGLSERKMENLRIFQDAIKNGTAGEHLVLIHQPELEPHFSAIQSRYKPESVAMGERFIDQKPGNAIGVYAPIKQANGQVELLPIGFLPSEWKLNRSVMAERAPGGSINVGPDGQPLLKQTSMNNQPWVHSGARETLTVDKDSLGDWMKQKKIRAVYADLADLQMATQNSGQREPFVKIKVTADNLNQSMQDFNRTGLYSPQTEKIKNVIQAVKAKTAMDAQVAVDQVKRTMPVETSDALIQKATPDQARTILGAEHQVAVKGMVDAVSGAKTPAELMTAVNSRFGNILDEGKAAEWFAKKDTLTLKDTLNGIHAAAEAGDPRALALYESTIIPYLKSGEFQSIAGGKAILEAPLLGNMGKVEAATVKKPTAPVSENFSDKEPSPEEWAQIDEIFGGKNGPEAPKVAPVAPDTTLPVETAPSPELPPKQGVLKAEKKGGTPSFEVAGLNDKTLAPDGSNYSVSIETSQSGKKQAVKYIVSENGERNFVDAMPLEKAQAKYDTTDPKILAERMVNPFVDYDFQNEAYKPKVSEPSTLSMETEVTQNKTGSTPDQMMEQTEINKPKEDVVEFKEKPGAWQQFQNNVHQGASDLITTKQKTLERGSEEWKKLETFKRSLTRDWFRKRMSSYRDNPNFVDADGHVDVNKAFDDFQGAFSSKLGSFGLDDPFTKAKNKADAFRLFHRTVAAVPKDRLVVETSQTGQNKARVIKSEQYEPASYFDDNLKIYNKNNGTDIQTVYFQSPSEGKKLTSEDVVKAMKENNFIPLGAMGNDVNSMFGVSFNPKLADAYDASIKSGNARYTSSLDKSALTDPYDKAARVLAVDVLGLSPDASAGDVLKRFKVLNAHETQNAVRNADGSVPTYRFLVAMKPPTLGGLGVVDDSFLRSDFGKQLHGSDATFEKAKTALKDRSAFDGPIYMTQAAFDKTMKANGFQGDHSRLKPTTVTEIKDPSGNRQGIIAQKGNIVVLDEPTAKKFEEMFGVKMGENDLLTFADNIKLGKEFLKPVDGLTDVTEFSMPATDMRIQYATPHKEASTFSSSILSKFASNDPSGKLQAMYKKSTDSWKSYVNDLQNAKSGEDLRKVFASYPEFDLKEDGFQDKIIKAMDNGAGKRSLGRLIEDQASSVFQNKVLSGSFIKGDHLYLAPDAGVVIDPKTGKERFLKTNEVAISQEKWKAMGKPEEMLVARFPVTRKTALIRAKVIPTKSLTLGDDQAVLGHHDVFVRMEGDHDGDSISLFKIGGDDGLPPELVANVDATRAKSGDMLLGEISKFPKAPVTSANLENAAQSAILGGGEIGKVAATMRVANDMVGANISVKVEPSGKGRTVKFYANGKEIDSAPIKGNGETGKFDVKWDDQQQFSAATLSQEAVDSLKSPALRDRIKASGMDDASYILFSEMFGTKDPALLKGIQDFAFKFQTPYQSANRGKPFENGARLTESIEDYAKFRKKLQDAGVDVGHFGRVFAEAEGASPIFAQNERILYRADENAVSAVKKAAEAKMITDGAKEIPQAQVMKRLIKNDPAVKSFIQFANKKRMESVIESYKFKHASKSGEAGAEDLKSVSDIRNEILGKFDEMRGNLSNEQVEAIQYWALTDEGANIKNGIITNEERNAFIKEMGNVTDIPDFRGRRSSQKAGDVWRLDEIFNDAPNELAKSYYNAFETFEPSEAAKTVILDSANRQMTKAMENVEEKAKKTPKWTNLQENYKKFQEAKDAGNETEALKSFSRVADILKRLKK